MLRHQVLRAQLPVSVASAAPRLKHVELGCDLGQ